MSSVKDPLSSSDLLSSIFTSKTDARIQRLSKILSTSSGVDTTLTLVGYGLFLVSSQISKLENVELKYLTHLFATNASEASLKANTKSVLKLADLEASTKTLAGMCSDFRTFTRLWGLLGVYALAKKNYVDPPKDKLLRGVAWTQTLALGGYYVYENGYYLAGKGVLRGWSSEKIKRWAKTSINLFSIYVVVEFVRLFRTRQLRAVKKVKAVSEKEVQDIEKEEEAWWRTAYMDLAFSPLCLHWSAEKPLLSDSGVGALMTLVGLIKFRAAWAATA